MSISQKYGRTYHFPFSPGTTNDDRINNDYWLDIQKIENLVITEKLDGENTCLNQFGVFARSHSAPTNHPWASYLKEHLALIKNDLSELEIFGENLNAIHSIVYPKIEDYFYVFAVRESNKWLSWEEVKFYAAMLDFSVVPEIKTLKSPYVEKKFKSAILDITKNESAFGSIDTVSNVNCTMEGVVCRNEDSYKIDKFKQNVFKFVRKGHVKTNEHWSRNWKRAKLAWEQ
ncbi:MAG: RNA ligase family protein [Bacteroidota bacterium]